MAGSCCSGLSPKDTQTGTQCDVETRTTDEKSLSEVDMCCEDGPCACDDDCLEELARVICIDDAGHIHNAEIPVLRANCETIELHDKECDDKARPSDGTCCKSMSDSILSSGTIVECPAKDTKCATDCAFAGLRKRSAGSPPPAYSEREPSDRGKKPCESHTSLARSRFAAFSAFHCICEAFLAHGLPSCCTQIKQRKVKKAVRTTVRFPRASNEELSKSYTSGCCSATPACGSNGTPVARTSCSGDAGSCKSSSRVSVDSCAKDSCCRGQGAHDLPQRSRVSLDSCCGKGGCGDDKPGCPSVKIRTSVDSHCGKGCCAGEKAPNISASAGPSDVKASCCGGGKSESRVSVDSCCEDSCCGAAEEPSGGCCDSGSCDDKAPLDLSPSVLENGLGTLEHAVLTVSGMTCTGCENKLVRTLKALPTITNIKTSLVLCRAEFDYDGGNTLESLVDVISKRSGFSIDIVTASSLRQLPLTVDQAHQVALLKADRPKGVNDLTCSGKNTLIVTYDPQLLGARSILEAYADYNVTLAPEPRDPALTAGASHIRSLALRVASSTALTIPVLVMAWAPLPANPRAYAIASLALATIVQTCITGPVYIAAFKSLFFFRLVETDMLVVLSTTAAYAYSVVAFAYLMVRRPLPTGEFFETSTLLVTLIMLGQLVSAYARQRAIEAISIRSLQSTTALLVRPDGREEIIDARLLQYGDTFKVVPDTSIITDGTVVSGHSSVDESMMTGESRPLDKTIGDAVVAGTLNGGGTLLVRVSRLPGENTIADIASMVDDARFSRAKVQSTVDKVCGWFVPVVLALAIITFVVWLVVGVSVRGQASGQAAVTALTYAIAVLAISCPCAIGLAVPMVILVAGGVAARHGLVFKAASTIEEARRISHVVFDKTGTLTQGKLDVVSAIYPSETGDIDIEASIRELVTGSKHPVARAVEAHLLQRGTSGDVKLADVQVVTGKGIQGVLSGSRIRGGSPGWLDLTSHPAVVPLLRDGLTVFCVSLARGAQDVPIAVFALSDVLRPEAAAVISALHAKNIRTSVLSGDHRSAVERMSGPLGIPGERLRAGCLPGAKQAYIKELEAKGERVLFVGDGTNDAAALAQATIGVHLHSPSVSEGTTISAASSAADVVLTHPSLTGLLTLFELSDAVYRRIVLNFAWSAVYNLVAILFAAGAFVNARITPAYAGLGEVVSVVPVVVVAMMLRWFKPQA